MSPFDLITFTQERHDSRGNRQPRPRRAALPVRPGNPLSRGRIRVTSNSLKEQQTVFDGALLHQ